MKKYHKIILVIIILCFCIGCDQVSKKIAKVVVPRTHSLSYVNGFFRLHYVENRGVFLGLGAFMSQEMRFFIFVILVAIGLLCMLFYVLKSSTLSTTQSIALSLIIGGGLGNLLDRIYNSGAVIDFMSIGIGKIRSGIFNFADVDIMIGTSLLLGLILKSHYCLKHSKKRLKESGKAFDSDEVIDNRQ